MAANNIKGLTVEIGGDTTKLGKALEEVNKKSRDLSSELGEINRLLKMDPGNADLLAQKQKVLAEAVKATAEKLETLREAEKQVQEQFERGEVSADQVRALQREIIATEKKMESYERATKETAAELDRLGGESKDAKKDVDKLGDEAEETGEDLEEAGDKASSFGDKAKKAGEVAAKGFAAVTAVVAAAVTALVASAEATREYRAEMGKLDTAFTTAGHSSEAATKTYKALQGVLGETEQAVEAANHLAKLTKSEKDLEKWTDICTGVYATFGASLPIEGLTEAANETAKTGALTGSLADALNWAGVSEEDFQAQLDACTDEQERQTLIMETLNGLYDDAAIKYKETSAEIIRANKATEEWTASMAEVGGVIEPLLTDVKLLGASLLSDLVPGIKEVASAFRGMLSGDDGAAASLGEAISNIFSQLLAKIAELLPSVAEMAISLITTLITSIIEALPQLLDTLVQVVLAVVQGITDAIPQIVDAIVAVIPQIVDALVAGIPQIIDGAVQLLLAILDAIPLIIPPLVEALPQIVMAIINGLLDAIPDLINGAITFLLAIVQAIPLLLRALLPQIPTIVDTIINGLLDNLPLLVDGAIQLFMGILEAIPEIQKALVENMPSIVSSIVTALLKAIPELIKAGGQLLSGLVKGMLDFDIVGAVKGVADSVVKGFKNVFQIHSPARRIKNEIGEPVVAGLTEGIEENADAPLDAMANITDDMIDGADALNGLTLERRLAHTFAAPDIAATAQSGLLAKLDSILDALERGQVLTIDGRALVGATVSEMDQALGKRRALVARGAI